MGTALAIPAFNAARTLPKIVRDIHDSYPDLTVIVVDDGSGDGTAQSVGRQERMVVLRHPVNMGKGGALRTAFDYALKQPIDLLITMDADGQHDVPSVGRFLENAHRADILIGNRMGSTGGMPRLRRVTNWTTSFIISLLAGRTIRDSQSGFRLMHRVVLDKLRLTTSKYDTESEILIQAGRAGLRIGHLPVPTLYTDGRSFIQPFRDTGRFIRLVLKTLLT